MVPQWRHADPRVLPVAFFLLVAAIITALELWRPMMREGPLVNMRAQDPSPSVAVVPASSECPYLLTHSGSCPPLDFVVRAERISRELTPCSGRQQQGMVIFHTFMKDVDWEHRAWVLVIKSYLLTQNTSRTIMFVWTEYAQLQQALASTLGRLVLAHQAYVQLRAWDYDIQIIGTPLEGSPHFGSYAALMNQSLPLVAYSDLVRLLLLHNYGGVWVDADVWFLRDMLPLIEGVGFQFSPTFHAQSGFNNHVLYRRARSALIRETLQQALLFPYANQEVWPETNTVPLKQLCTAPVC